MRHLPLLATVALLAALLLGAGVFFDPEARAERQRQAYRSAMINRQLEGLDVLLTAAWRVLPFVVIGVVLLTVYRRYGRIASVEAHYTVQALEATHRVPHSLTYAPRYDGRGGTHAPPALAAVSTAAVLPTAPTLAQLRAEGWQPTPQRLLLGYSAHGAIYGPVSQLLSTAVAGRPGQGKSTLLRFVAWQVLTVGGEVAIIDPHGSILEDVGSVPVRFTASTSGELGDAAAVLSDELDRRITRYRAGARVFPPLVMLLDELAVVSIASKPAMQAASDVILQGRKVGMFAFISGQALPAGSFGGRLARDGLSSRFVFRTTADEARRAGLTGDAARLVLDLKPGVAVLDAGALDTPEAVAIPDTTATDLATLRLPPEDVSVADVKPFGSHSVATSERLHTAPISAEAARAADLFLAGLDPAAIVAELRQVKSSEGGRYQRHLAEVLNLIREGVAGQQLV